MAGPNFFVIGAPKAATTALYHALRGHDGVFLPEVKEPHFYAYLADRSAAGHLYPDEASARRRYAELYAGVDGESAIGDSSTTNLVVAGAAEAIAADVPERADRGDPAPAGRSRLLALVALPRGRWRADRRLRRGGTSGGAAAGGGLSVHVPLPRAGVATARSCRAFFERFGRDRVLVHLYDDLCADPDAPCCARRCGSSDSTRRSEAAPRIERHNEMPVPRFPRSSARSRAAAGPGAWCAGSLPPAARQAAAELDAARTSAASRGSTPGCGRR